jgi:hypothetical protein
MPAPARHAVSVFNRPRWSEDEAREALAALGRSGQSVSAFAAEHDLDPQRLYSWRRRLGARAERTTFQELAILPEAAGAGSFEIVLASGTVVRVPWRFDTEALASLLAVVAQSLAC